MFNSKNGLLLYMALTLATWLNVTNLASAANDHGALGSGARRSAPTIPACAPTWPAWTCLLPTARATDALVRVLLPTFRISKG